MKIKNRVKQKMTKRKQKQKRKIIKKEVKKKKRAGLDKEIFQGDVKSFLEKFKADIARKREEYRQYAQEFRKRKKP